MYNVTYTLNHEIIKHNKDVDDVTINNCKNIFEIEKIPTYNKRLVITNNDFAVKFLDYSINKLNSTIPDYKNSEIFLVNQYLEKNLYHPYYLPYLAITNVINFSRKIITYINVDNSNVKNESISLIQNMNIGIIMPKYKTLEKYLFEIQNLDHIVVLTNIYNILDLAILIRDKYNMIHCDVKLDNIVVDDNKFYLIDWENAFEIGEKYYHEDRPAIGNSEMYPHYDTDSEQFFVYSIGVLITRIIGFHYSITCHDFINNNLLHFILSKIPNSVLGYYEDLLIHIFVIKINKIEVLKDKISKIIHK
jgi:hypothetical protein